MPSAPESVSTILLAITATGVVACRKSMPTTPFSALEKLENALFYWMFLT